MSARSLTLALVVMTASGCARPQQSATHVYWWPAPSQPAPAPAPGEEALPAPAPKLAASAGPGLAKIDPETRAPIAPIPGGDACIEVLQQRGVAFSRRQGQRGVATPILVNGPIGGVKFFSDATPFIADCRLVVALSDLAPELAELGVSQVRFSGAYVYRVKTTGSGRLSLHAYGLAIDVHDIWFGSERLNVKVNFTRGLGRECQPNLPRLNDLVCRIRERRVFKELLTPDDDANHHDHFHFGLAPLPNEIPPEPPPVIVRKPVRNAPVSSPLEEPLAHPEDEHERGGEKPEGSGVRRQSGKAPKAGEPKPDKTKVDKTRADKNAEGKLEKGKLEKGKLEKGKLKPVEKPRGDQGKVERTTDDREERKSGKAKAEKSEKAERAKDDPAKPEQIEKVEKAKDEQPARKKGEEEEDQATRRRPAEPPPSQREEELPPLDDGAPGALPEAPAQPDTK